MATADAAASALAGPVRTYTALGGSNTCGHGLRHAAKTAFQQRIAHALSQKAGTPGTDLAAATSVGLQPSCIPAMGPDYPASCLSYFAPNTTAYATLEFTPNMGEQRELERNGAHLMEMALALGRRGARVVLSLIHI